MSENWAERQRLTNQLVRISADYVFNQKTVLAEQLSEQLYGLCKLTWTTSSYDGDNPAYIRSTKIPALSSIFQNNCSDNSIEDIAKEISKILVHQPNVSKWITSHTGFTSFYGGYRNSSLEWIKDNFLELLPLFKEAFYLSSDEQRLELIKKVAHLPSIPSPNDKKEMPPEYLITPVFFALDSRIRFPIINGEERIKKLLSKLKVTDASLDSQFSEMIKLYGTGGIKDAADLDQIGRDIIDFVQTTVKQPTKKLLTSKPTTGGETELPLKDESDLISLQEARTVTSKRLHNGLTNKLKSYLTNYTLLEGCDNRAMFDVLVKNYDANEHDLLIEVKRSSEAAHIRMAIGQLYDYWFTIKGDVEPHLAILIPNKPDKDIIKLLEWLDIGILWFSGEELETCCDCLNMLIKN
ncbi:MAG: hypothetical protein EXR80_05985 [Methylococcales bacterium]|nr:hypothetical protein [Methylococcales bacterium]